MTYLNYMTETGQMCNHFYFALQAYLLQKRIGRPVQYLTNQFFREKGLKPRMQAFNLMQYVNDTGVVSQDDNIVSNSDGVFYLKYHQQFMVDFNIEQLESFISDIILKSQAFRQALNQLGMYKNAVGLHVRLGDYVHSKISNCFDKRLYLTRCFGNIPANITEIDVYSDDIGLCQNMFGNLLASRFGSIRYSVNAPDIEDFVQLSLHQTKILWNSTFSYWAAFVGNVLYKNTYDSIYAPAMFSTAEPICSHVNPLWNIIL